MTNCLWMRIKNIKLTINELNVKRNEASAGTKDHMTRETPSAFDSNLALIWLIQHKTGRIVWRNKFLIEGSKEFPCRNKLSKHNLIVNITLKRRMVVSLSITFNSSVLVTNVNKSKTFSGRSIQSFDKSLRLMWHHF